jgi:hypothetical protein
MYSPALFAGVSRLSWFEPVFAICVIGQSGFVLVVWISGRLWAGREVCNVLKGAVSALLATGVRIYAARRRTECGGAESGTGEAEAERCETHSLLGPF